MKSLAWLTDIHLNFVGLDKTKTFCRSIADRSPDGVLIGGDIAEARDLRIYLEFLEKCLQRPIYFVLGNHDFYGGSISLVRSEMEEMVQNSSWLSWLPKTGIVPLNAETCLIGHDSWADGRLGDYDQSEVMLNDYYLIEELTDLDPHTRRNKLNRMGDEAAADFDAILPQVLDQYREILVLTHVPPFREACWHQGKISSDDFLPHFSCKAVGDKFKTFMQIYPDRNMTVFCGHTHSPGIARILPNLVVKTGGADYGKPQLQELIMINSF